MISEAWRPGTGLRQPDVRDADVSWLMAIEWLIETEHRLDINTLAQSVTSLLRTVAGWEATSLRPYDTRAEFDRANPAVETAIPNTDWTFAIIGDHTTGVYVEIQRTTMSGDASYSCSARRDVVSMITTFLVAVCLADLTGTDVTDESLITGRPSIQPADVIRLVQNVGQIKPDGVSVSSAQLAEALGLPW